MKFVKMQSLPNEFLLILLLVVRWCVLGQVFQASHAALGYTLSNSSAGMVNTSSATFQEQKDQISTPSDCQIPSTTGPVPFSASGICPFTDPYCTVTSGTQSIDEATINGLGDQCILWDNSCSGNRTRALQQFFDTSLGDHLLGNFCFRNQTGCDCDMRNPPGRLSEFEKIKSWMRSPQCVSAQNQWAVLDGEAALFGSNSSTTQSTGSDWPTPSCCGQCFLYGLDVDVYYWPDPDANSSCLSIVGESVRPIDYGATTDSRYPYDIYWGCTAKDPDTFLITEYNYGTIQTIQTAFNSILTTAVITSIGSVTFKSSLFNPWSLAPCISEPSVTQSLINHTQPSIQARGHSLIIQSSFPQNSGLPVSTVVSGGFTL